MANISISCDCLSMVVTRRRQTTSFLGQRVIGESLMLVMTGTTSIEVLRCV